MQKPLSNLSKPNLTQNFLLIADDMSNKGGVERVVSNLANALCERTNGGGNPHLA